ncbi:hypothetical protein QU487_06355 [Crenobacter sp. SG2305]|uniref:hypothetical protein n=1 Tax=Crenobacter oryzisoli TaxID=3056844 RepID=UPI0025AAE9BF|nr:hypothetical protein [Crenobacter sp. SG2305]MDN0082374.1 hypothetical protein [Crenobacter sp. SG2305]
MEDREKMSNTTPTLSLEEFRASETKLSVQRFCEIFGISEADQDAATVAVLCYADNSCYIEKRDDGRFSLMLGREETISADKDLLTAKLYVDFYLPEIVGQESAD